MGNVSPGSFDEMAECLSVVQRRRLLIALIERDPPVDLATVLTDRSHSSTTAKQRISFHHVHLPKLAACGFVRWNEARDEVRAGPAFDEIKPLLETLLEHETELPDDWL